MIIRKSSIKKYDMNYILSLIYNDKIPEDWLKFVPKEKLVDFVLAAFNRGFLDNCYIKDLDMYRG